MKLPPLRERGSSKEEKKKKKKKRKEEKGPGTPLAGWIRERRGRGEPAAAADE